MEWAESPVGRLLGPSTAIAYVSGRPAAELAAFQAELAGFGSPWGNDEIGSLIGAAHDEVSSYAFECYQDALDEIAAAGIDVGESVRGLRRWTRR